MGDKTGFPRDSHIYCNEVLIELQTLTFLGIVVSLSTEYVSIERDFIYADFKSF